MRVRQPRTFSGLLQNHLKQCIESTIRRIQFWVILARWLQAVARLPVAPTDPDLPNSGIRLLGLWSRYAAVNTVNDTRLREQITRTQTSKLYPRNLSMP